MPGDHGKQLAGHFIIDRDGIVRWMSLEAERGIHTIVTFRTPEEIVAAVRTLHREPSGRANPS